ncbi:olfactory receptor 1509-like [Polypterus senegalus]|uniref:olfactory receptor 1509-like n=1 Tax=Polypterus senegalus TaxID=55291 RepID=UPI001965B644|nr:olfactory receptor 1509-like [Polypterus senegalus]
MSSQSPKSAVNDTFVYPEMFYIKGFHDMPFAYCFYIFLIIVYIFTVIFNMFLIVLIYIEESLHNAKYIAVSHLAIADVCTTTAVIPKLTETFLFNSHFISYKACLADMFFVHFFSSMQSLSLAILAYDRFIAICFPLRYHNINTNSRMVIIILSVWLFSAVMMSTTVLLITKLSFCQSTEVNSYFCDHGPVYRLACNDFYLNLVIGFADIALLLFAPLAFILISYVAIGFTLLKITTAEGRRKALKTCTSHIILVAVFYVPLAFTYVASQFANFHTNTRILNNTLSATLPPMVNPIIYTLKTEEVMSSIKKLYKRRKDRQGRVINTMFLAK